MDWFAAWKLKVENLVTNFLKKGKKFKTNIVNYFVYLIPDRRV